MQQSTSIIVSFRVDSMLELGGRGTRSKIVGTPVFYKGRIYVGSGQEAEHGEGPGRLVCLDPTKTGDMYAVDLSDARVVTAYLFPGSLEKLKPQFRKMREGALILTHHFNIPTVEPAKQWTVRSRETGDEHRIWLYRMPLKECRAGAFEQ